MFHAAVTPVLPASVTTALVLGSAVVLLNAALCDVAIRILPNRAALALLAIGLALRASDGTLPLAVAAAAAVFAVMFLLWWHGIMGGGDVKLLAACATLVPPAGILSLLLATALAGGVLAGLYLALGRLGPRRFAPRRPRSLPGRVWRIECWRISRRGPLPYGCAIAAGVLLVQHPARPDRPADPLTLSLANWSPFLSTLRDG